MAHPVLLSSLLLLLVPATSGATDPVEPETGRAEITIHQRIIIRILRAGPQTRAAPTAPAPPPIAWVEKRADKCVPVIDLAAATISDAGSVDLVLNGGKRLRARLENHCPSLAFYGGVYLRPTADGKLCAGRDLLLARSGGECRIDRFRALEIKR